MTIARKYQIYDLCPYKSPFRPLSAFKFDPAKFSDTVEKLKAYVKNIKQKLKIDIGFRPALE